jgi:hypothetical protein
MAGVYLDEMLGLAMESQVQTRAAAAGLLGFQTIRARAVLPGANDPAQLAYTAARGLVLVTRNFQDFVRLNEFWTVLREWGHSPQPHAGILIPLGSVLDRNWADRVMDLLLHPNCPSLADQLLVWQAKTGDWVTDHPYSNQRRREVRL